MEKDYKDSKHGKEGMDSTQIKNFSADTSSVSACDSA